MTVKCEECGALKYLDAGVDPASVTCTCGAALKPVPVTLPDRAGPDGSRIRAIGRYELKRTLGRGGMGEVLLAYDPKLDREVALKVLHSASAATAEDLARFQQEARTAAQLQHPNIVPTFDFGEVDGLHYLTQEFIDGKSLEQVIDDAPVSPRRAVEILALLAGAVQHAHEQGVIHRDLKPANVLVAADGTPRLTDFGLARRLGQSQLTKTGAVMGTPAYMPPEQAQGDMSKVDARSDVYGLGALLYELLTLNPPFDGESPMQVLYQVVRNDPVAPAQRDPRIAAEISAICMKCLEKRPADRYQSAAELAEDCHRYLDGEPVRAKPAGLLKRTWRRVQRNKALVATGAVAAVLLAGGVGGVYYRYAVWPEQQRAAARAAAEAARTRAIAEGERRVAEAQAALETRGTAAAAALARSAIQSLSTLAGGPPAEPISNAHLVLADVARAEERPIDVRQSLFQAYRAALGAPAEHQQLVRIGHRLFANRDIALARQIFEHILVRTTPDPATAFEARLGIAKCTAGWGEFKQARDRFASLPAPPAGTAAHGAELAAWRTLLDALAPERRLPVTLSDCRLADLDGDGTREVAVLQGGTVVVGRIGTEGWTELGKLRFFRPGEKPHRLSGFDALDLDANGTAELVIAGAHPDDKRGSLAVAEWDGAALRLRSRLKSTSLTCARPFAMADVQGNGRKRLAFITGYYGRAVVLCDYTPASGLRVVFRQSLGSDISAVLAADVDGDGRDELWVFAGSYGNHNNSLIRLAWNDTERRFDIESRPVASQYHLDPGRRSGEPEILLATGWHSDAAAYNLVRFGREGFRKRYLPEGAYFITMAPPWPSFRPLVQLPWPEEFSRRGTDPVAGRLRAGGREFAWLRLRPERRTAEGDPLRAHIYVRNTEAPERWDFLSEVLTWNRSLADARPVDLDGDGDDELVAGRTVYGLGPAPAPATDSSRRAGTAAELPPPSRASKTLRAAREARRLGVLDEAERLYREELQRPASREALEEGARGLIRCLLQARRLGEAATEAHALIDRFPLLLGTLGDLVRDALVDAGEWREAAKFARKQLRDGSPSSKRRAELNDILRQDRTLAKLRPAFDLQRLRDRPTDLLATAPWIATPAPDGGWRLRWCGQQTGHALLIPVAPASKSLRLTAEWTLHRHDWHTHYAFEITSGDPWRLVPGNPERWDPAGGGEPEPLLTLHSDCKGATEFPLAWMKLHAERTHELAGTALDPGARLAVILEYAKEHDKVRAELEHPVNGRTTVGAPRTPVEAAGPTFVVLRGHGGANAVRYWGDLTLHRLTIASADDALSPIRFRPSRPVESLWLAHGRWIQGRLDEALAGYDHAIANADDATWVGVDARFWRALLRAERGDDAASVRAELLEARRRSPKRFLALIVGSAEPLRERPRAAGAVAGALRLLRTEQPTTADFARELLHAYGYPVARAVMVGEKLDLEEHVAVWEIQAADSLQQAEAPLLEDDYLLQYAGVPVTDFYRFLSQQHAARRAAAPVAIVIERGNERLTHTIDPTKVWIRPKRAYRLKPR